MSEMVKTEIKEDEEEEEKPLLHPQEPTTHPLPKPVNPKIPNTPNPSQRAFSFWAYFTLSVSLLTLILTSLPSLHHKDHRSWFLNLPDDLRHHYSNGKLIKVQPKPNSPPIQLFAIESGPRDAETVLLLHGLGSNSYSFRRVLSSLASAGLRAVAIDFPGSGFSDELEDSKNSRGRILGWIWDVYSDIKEKGLFWGFDQLVETGYIPYDGSAGVSTRKEGEHLGYGSVEMGRIVGQVIDLMALAPVNLVIHDSALGAGTNWASANSGLVSSITFIDSAAESAAFPSWILGTPVFSELVLRSRFLFAGLLRLCCSRSIDGTAAEAHRLLLEGRAGRRAIVAAGKALNGSFDLGEWVGSEEVKGLPFLMLWSNTWSDRWIDEGRQAAVSVSQAKFAYHSGGRWPQEDAAEEIAGMIAQFVSPLPKSGRHIEEQPLPPQHIQNVFNEASNDGYHHHHHGHGRENSAGIQVCMDLARDGVIDHFI